MENEMILAALNYAIEQAETSDIDILSWAVGGDTLLVEDQIKELKAIRSEFERRAPQW